MPDYKLVEPTKTNIYKTLDMRPSAAIGTGLEDLIIESVKGTQQPEASDLPNRIVLTQEQFDSITDDEVQAEYKKTGYASWQTDLNVMDVAIMEEGVTDEHAGV